MTIPTPSIVYFKGLFSAVLRFCVQFCKYHVINCSKMSCFSPVHSRLGMPRQQEMIIAAVLGSTLRLVLISDIESLVPI